MALQSQPQQPLSLEPTMKQPAPSSQEKVSAGFTAVNQSYLTPPNDVHHSFSSEDAHEQSRVGQAWDNKLPPLQERSPPVSPDMLLLPSIGQMTAPAGIQSTDPPLYPDEPNHATQFDTPLFPTVGASPPSKGTDPYSFPPKTSTPPPANLTFRSRTLFPQRLGITSPKEAMDYYHNRLEEIRRNRTLLPDPRTFKSGDRTALDSVSQKQLDKFQAPRVTKPAKLASKSAKAKVSASMVAPVTASSPPPPPSPPKAPAEPRRKRATRARSEPHSSPSPASQGQQHNKHTRAPPSKKDDSEGLHWSQIHDYSPPISTLNNMTAKLTTEWGHNSLDLSNDPDRHHLHAQEIRVAEILRFSCAQYLGNKRRIFEAKVKFLKNGKNFPRTEAQKSCHCDVNKTSRMWVAFNGVGWFDDKWFEKYL